METECIILIAVIGLLVGVTLHGLGLIMCLQLLLKFRDKAIH